METLISTREIGPLSGFRSKMGRAFNAIVRLTDDYEMKFDFGNEADQAQEKVDFQRSNHLENVLSAVTLFMSTNCFMFVKSRLERALPAVSEPGKLS